MSAPIHPEFLSFLSSRRDALAVAFSEELIERVRFYRDKLPRDVLDRLSATFLDLVLGAMRTGEPHRIVEQSIQNLEERTRLGMVLEETFELTAVFRHLMLETALSAIASGVEGSLDGVRFIEGVCYQLLKSASDYYTGVIESARRELAGSESRYRNLVERSPDAVAVHRDGTFLYVNQAGARILGEDDPTSLLGRTLFEFYPPEQRESVRVLAARAEASRQSLELNQETVVRRDGTSILLEVITSPIVYEGVPAMQTVFRDVTARRRAEEAARLHAVQEETIRTQRELLRTLSTPLVPLGSGVILVPLVGAMDGARAEQMMSVLLGGVVEHAARFAILDVTGVPSVDGVVAEALLRATQAVRLLGAQVILTGIGPSAARTLVDLGVDLAGLVTRATLRDGITKALG